MCSLFRPGGRGWRGVRRSRRKEEEEQMDKRLGLNPKQMYLLKVRVGHWTVLEMYHRPKDDMISRKPT